MRQKLLFICVMLTSQLAACAIAPPPPAASAPAKPLNSPTVTAPPPAAAPRGEPVIEIERSGGIAGKSSRTVVYANGELMVNNAATAQLGTSAAQKLVADLEAAGFFALQEGYRSRCNDCYQYRITVTGPTQTKTVSYVEDGKLPDDVMKVIAVLATIK